MRVLELPHGWSPFAWGHHHGQAFCHEIHELAAIRLQLAVEFGSFRGEQEVLEIAARHLPVLEEFDLDLHAELTGIAEGAGLSAAEVVVLNHYTDLRDLGLNGYSPPEDGCSAVFSRQAQRSLLGQTWDMHGSAMRYVIMLKVPASDLEGGLRPAAWLFTVVGCLGMAGLNSSGVGVTINNITCVDARVGLVWPAVVRGMLRERSAQAAREVLDASSLGSGHHYLVADSHCAYGIEITGSARQVVYDGSESAFVHTNHCIDSRLQTCTRISPASTTFERHDKLVGQLNARPICTLSDLWQLLGSHDGYPRSVCTHLVSPVEPHAMATCGGLAMDLSRRELWTQHGCLNHARPARFGFD